MYKWWQMFHFEWTVPLKLWYLLLPITDLTGGRQTRSFSSSLRTSWGQTQLSTHQKNMEKQRWGALHWWLAGVRTEFWMKLGQKHSRKQSLETVETTGWFLFRVLLRSVACYTSWIVNGFRFAKSSTQFCEFITLAINVFFQFWVYD